MFATEIIRHPDGRTSKVFRAGQGPLVVWLHGPHGIRGRDPVIAELAKRHTVVAPLAPGFADLAELDEIRNVHEWRGWSSFRRSVCGKTSIRCRICSGRYRT
jgi:hypothetical protein